MYYIIYVCHKEGNIQIIKQNIKSIEDAHNWIDLITKSYSKYPNVFKDYSLEILKKVH